MTSLPTISSTFITGEVPSDFLPASPFLSGTSIQFAMDSTSLGYLKACPRLYQLVILEGWSPKDESLHLRFGSEYHSAIQDFELLRADGVKFEDAVDATIHQLLIRIRDWEVDKSSKIGNYKNPETLLQLTIDYLDHYRNDPAKTFILENGKPAVELSFKFELNFGPQAVTELPGLKYPTPYILCGHLDRVVSIADDLFVLDHKTTTTTPSSYFFDGFNPFNQMTLYTLAGKVVLNAPIKGVIIEAAQILLEKPSAFERGFTHRTQDQLDEWVENLAYWLRLAEMYATANFWPMNDTACSMYGGCKFRGVCSKSPQVREIYLKSDFVKLEEKDRWNPLKPR